MSLSETTLQRLAVLQRTAPEWAPYATEPQRLLERETVAVVRAEAAEPVTLGQLNELAAREVPDVSASSLAVERRQRPDPAGEGSIGYYVLLQMRPMTDEEFAAKVDTLWARRERALLVKQGVNPTELALYRELDAKYRHLQAA